MSATPERRVIDIVRDVVSDIDPVELFDFDYVAESYVQSPQVARRAGRGGNEPTASSWDVAAQTLSTVAIAVGVEICKDLIINGAKAAGRRHQGRVLRVVHWFRRTTVDPCSVAPPLPPERTAEIRAKAVARATAYGASEEVAHAIAAGLVRRWTPPL